VKPGDHEPEVGSLSDEALVRQTLPLASRFGCNLAIAAGLIALACGLVLGVRVGVGTLVVSVCLVALAQFWRSRTLAVRRARRAEHEFQRRFGAAPMQRHLAEARAQLAADAELELLGLFRGRVLPHGALRSMRLEIKKRAQPMLFVSACPPLNELQRGASGGLEPLRREAPLTAAQAERMRAQLRELASESLAPLASFVMDGFPCEVSVLQQSGPELHASANLAGLPDQLKSHPSVRMIELFLDLEAELFVSTGLS
jgi:hypothetical protein